MKIRYMIAAVVGFLIGGLVIVAALSPRIVDSNPEDELIHRSGRLGLTFSQPMAAEEVEAHFEIEPFLEGDIQREANSYWFRPKNGFNYNDVYTVTLTSGARSEKGLWTIGSYKKSFQVKEPKLLFLKEGESGANLWIYEDGAANEQISEEPLGIWDYEALSNGQEILMTRIDADGSDDLLLINRDGSKDVILECLDVRCRDASQQPGGSMIAYERQPINGSANSGEVWLYDPASGLDQAVVEPELIEMLGANSMVSQFPRWSSDGQLLAYFKPDARFIVIQPISGGEPFLIPANLEMLGDWSPGGNQIAYIEQTTDGEALESHLENNEDGIQGDHIELANHLVVADIVTGEVVDLGEGTFNDGYPVWHPSGEFLALPREVRGEGRQIWLVFAEEKDPIKVTNDPKFTYSGLSWAPDGDRLAVMRIPADGSSSSAEIMMLGLESGEVSIISDSAFVPGWLP